MKLLILQMSSIGNIVLSTPVVRCLKKQLPGAVVHFCTKPDHAPIVDSNPYIDKVHYQAGSLYRLIRQLRAEQFDCVIDLQNNFTTALIRKALGVQSYSVDNLGFRKWLYVRWKVNLMPSQHVVDRYLEALQPLGVKNDDFGLDYFIPYKDQVETDWLPPTHRDHYIAFAIGGRHATNRLPIERLVELCSKINHPIVLLGDKRDRVIGEQVEKQVGTKAIYNACGLFNLNQSASIIQGAWVVFSHDTGLMQIAAAFRKKVFSIWGSTTPNFGETPYKTSYLRLEKSGLSCRPCSLTGSGKCPKGHFRCMNELPFKFEEQQSRQQKENLD
ncbi:glycosyltransferase family 9 protein [Spirosoma montaniterrae]|nr:glycosyltransferase family 9 protein [Spirosoma montaniterrae]